MFNTIILFIIGFFILIKGASILVRGASSVARLFNISYWVIGVVIVGMGTSLPELSISLAATLEGSSVGLGNIVGSNMVNSFLVLGLLALFVPMTVRPIWIKRDFMIAAGSVILIGLLAYLPIFHASPFLGLGRTEGFIIFSIFLAWFWYLTHPKEEETTEEKIDEHALGLLASIAYIIFGVLGVFFGGQWVVSGAGALAAAFGASETLIGLTVVAIGTSLPELAVSFAALRGHSPSIALGNLVGSNTFNFLGILGLTAIVKPIPFTYALLPDMILAALSIIVLSILIVFVGKKYELERWQGALLIVLYVAYLLFIILRG